MQLVPVQYHQALVSPSVRRMPGSGAAGSQAPRPHDIVLSARRRLQPEVRGSARLAALVNEGAHVFFRSPALNLLDHAIRAEPE